jgi:ABC-type Mn2+/Zn2+ transport system ATPase subunit
MANALAVRDLAVSFGATPVLTGVTFSVEAGTTLAVIGPNGSGKTALFKALVGSIPHAGEIRWAASTRIGYVPQRLDVERDLPITGMDLLTAKSKVTRAPADLSAALRDVGLGGEANKPIGTLSGGQLQRLLVALALVGRPNVLLLDEPLAGVDEPGQEKLNELVRRVQARDPLTVLLISHDLSVVYRHATNVLCLRHDHPCFGPPRDILTPQLLHEVYGPPLGYHVHDA